MRDNTPLLWSGIIGHVGDWTSDGRRIEHLEVRPNDLPLPLVTTEPRHTPIGAVDSATARDDGKVWATGRIMPEHAGLLPSTVGMDVRVVEEPIRELPEGLSFPRARLEAVTVYELGDREPGWPDCSIRLVGERAEDVGDAGLYPDNTGGHTRAPASEAAAIAAEEPGPNSRSSRQREVHGLLAAHGMYGATWRELDREMGVGHSVISGALTRLHKAGHIARLAHQRQGCHVYVLAGLTEGRAEVPYRPQIGATVGALVPIDDLEAFLEVRVGGGNVHWWRDELTRFLADYGVEVR